MEYITEEYALSLLKKHATTKQAYAHIVTHAKAVRAYAEELAEALGADIKFVNTAALLHDIGRFQCPPPSKENAVKHGIVGANILRKEKLPKHARCCERHVGAGITKTEATKLGLPKKSYLPVTLEEKIVSYADSCMKGTKNLGNSYAVKRYKKEVNEAVAKRQQRLHTFLMNRLRK